MESNETVTLTRDCEASVIPVGTKVTLQAGELAHITQSLGGTFTVVVNGNMFRIETRDADALGKVVEAKPRTPTAAPGVQLNREDWKRKSGTRCGSVMTLRFP